VKRLRVSIVQYLNTAPLVRGLTHGPLRGKYELSFTVPSQCAEELRTGAADIAILPAIEYQRIEGLAILPNLAIASKNKVRSLLLVAKEPLGEIRRIALDRSSRSTQALTRILCAKKWKITPEFFEAEPDVERMLQEADAGLVIGDPALRLALSGAGGAGFAVHDIVEEWRALTDLPAVLAVWAARREVVTAEIADEFRDSLAFGMEHIEEIAQEASQEMGLPAGELLSYLRENIQYRLDDEDLRGLRKYYEYAAELGLIEEAKEILISRGRGETELAGATRVAK